MVVFISLRKSQKSESDFCSSFVNDWLEISSQSLISLSFISFAALLVKVTAKILSTLIFFHQIRYAIL